MKHLLTKMNSSLKYKLLGVLLLMSFIPITLASFSWYHSMTRSAISQSSEIADQYTRFMAEELSSYLTELNQALNPLLLQPEFQSYLTLSRDNIRSQAVLAAAFRPQLQTILQSYQEVAGILYLDRQGKIMYDSYQNNMNYGYDFNRDSFFSEVQEVQSVVLGLSHPASYLLEADQISVPLIRPVVNLRTGKVDSWLVVEIRESFFTRLAGAEEHTDKGEILLYHPESGRFLAGTHIEPEFQEYIIEAFRKEGLRGGIRWSWNNGEYEAISRDIIFGGWKLVWIYSLDPMLQGVRYSLLLTIVIAVGTLLLALILAFPAMDVVLQPLYRLINGINELSRGIYQPIRHETPGEIGFVIDHFNRLLIDLKDADKQAYDAIMREKERELLQLQAQTNPHLFFNTLEAISSYARINQPAVVEDMIDKISSMMRYSIRNDGGWVPLSEEISYIHDFIRIHDYRNGASIDVILNIPSCGKELEIMKLSIQPFVENALKYGWSSRFKENEFQLCISVHKQDGRLVVTVENTGVPIDGEVMEQLQELLVSERGGKSSFFARHTGIANVYRRLRLWYGKDLEFTIESTNTFTRFRYSAPLADMSEEPPSA
ncbi:sensor histidine kinase [Paenibacillus sp. S150]|uniref:cache domain-containing sensor histidine kinase n=1 Tax=Paenibacillus sp. S150 TaxID=2749826 RepID=UPI001C5828B2|nr:sensor histidine kinase [Paenibacillus sp. S150]MBW4081005.1 histidine kinase [Paenibacillus sp. S150]